MGVERVDEQQPHADSISCRQGPEDGFSNEQSAESRSLFPVVHGQPTEEDGGHRVRHVAANSPGKHCVLDGYC